MVETIDPVVHGGRRSRYLVSVFLHALGATLAAAVVGLLAGAAGMAVGAPWGVAGLAALIAIAALYAVRELTGLPVPIPDRHRQVPEWWRSFYSRHVAALLYGFGLGVGYLTFLSFGTYVAVTAAAFVSGDPLLGAALCAPFGLGRALSVVAANAGSGTPRPVDRLDDLSQTFWPRGINAAALVAVVLFALGGL